MATTTDYIGTELGVFAQATHWKSYWSNAIDQYMGQSVIDVGAGIGATAQVMSGRAYKRWVELEPDSSLVERIRELQRTAKIPPHYEIVNGLSSDIASGEAFDTALYIDVLEHIENDANELAAISRLIVPGGHIIVLAPAHNYLYSEFDKQIGHFRRYDKDMLLAIQPKDFEVVALRYLDSVGMLASLANRVLLRSGSPNDAQVKAWDKLMVPVSRRIDGLLGHRLGKSILYVLRRRAITA